MPNFDWSKTVFPLLVAGEREPKPIAPEFLGTCFFSELQGFPILITAKHVVAHLKDDLESERKSLYIGTQFGRQTAIKLSRYGVVNHTKVDITILLLTAEIFESHADEFLPINLDFGELNLGTDVMSFGFPESLRLCDDGTLNRITEIHNFCFKGFIANIENRAEIGGTLRTYRVNFPGMPGISGAPLITLKDGQLVCVGVMIGEDILREKYTFGVACDASKLHEFEGILAEFNKRGK